MSTLNRRFWEKVQRAGDRACWMWKGATDHRGYGVIHGDGKHGRCFKAHRVSYKIAFGSIPSGMWVLHRCDTPGCVNPAHLFLGDHDANMRDMVSKGRSLVGSRHWSRITPAKVASGERNGARTRPDRRARGERNGHAKITADDVREIRRLRAAGTSGSALSRRYGLSPAAVCDIVKRRNWSHIV